MAGDWKSIIEQAVALRRELHRRPELTWEEAETAARVRQQLDGLDIPWRACADYGTVATLAAGARGEHIALRGDMDALPIEEGDGLPDRSEVAGKMHACGHDGHTAALWATAAWLKAHEGQLPGPVSLLFQPAEEGGHGARRMIEDGALEGVDRIFGWHNWPAIPFGQAVCPDGAVMSGNGTFHITLHGQGGHASQPELCRDPVLAAAALTMNLQQVVSRRMPPQSATVLSVASIEAPSAPTVTPQSARLEGSIRLADPSLRATINGLIEQIARDTASTYGVEAEVLIKPRYEATINHPVEAARFRAALEQEFGEHWRMDGLALPIMASEDFHYYLNAVPGAFALIGMARGEEFHKACHSPDYRFNDELLAPVVRLFSRLVGAPLP